MFVLALRDCRLSVDVLKLQGELNSGFEKEGGVGG